MLIRLICSTVMGMLIAGSAAQAQSQYQYQPPPPPPGVQQNVPPQYTPPPQAVPVPVRSPWALCANEEEICHLKHPALVRYGANGRYVERTVNFSFFCTNDLFGDPAPKLRKQCEIRTENHQHHHEY